MDSLSDQVILIIIASVFLLIVAVGIILLVFIYQKKTDPLCKGKRAAQNRFRKTDPREQAGDTGTDLQKYFTGDSRQYRPGA